MAVLASFFLCYGAPAYSQHIRGGTQVALIARMPDRFTVRWPIGSGRAPLGVLLERGITVGLGGQLLPGANLAAACQIRLQSRPAKVDQVNPLPHGDQKPGVLTCDGAFRAVVESLQTKIPNAHLVEFRAERPAGAIRIDVTISVL